MAVAQAVGSAPASTTGFAARTPPASTTTTGTVRACTTRAELLAEDVSIRQVPAVAGRLEEQLGGARRALAGSGDETAIVRAAAAVGAIWRPLTVLRGEVDAAEHRDDIVAVARSVLGLG